MNPVGEGSHQVFLCASPASIPVSVIPHTWFVVSQNGALSRWEVLFRRERADHSWGYLHLNEREPFEGLDMVAYMGGPRWRGCVLSMIDGDEDSVAAHMGAHILNSPNTYPYRDRYSLLGPNSNTYTQWVLSAFPNSGLILPRHALGKSF